MRLIALLAAGGCALMLAACQLEAPDPPALPPAKSCGAEGLSDLIGRPATVLETMRFAAPTRILRPGMAMTMDYAPGRLNIEIDAQEVIVRLFCG